MALAIVDAIGKLLGGATAPAIDYFKARQEVKSRERIRRMELRDALHTRQLDLAKAGLTADMNWEQAFAEQAASSWKDEYALGIVSIPAVLAFIKTEWLDGPTIVAEGFAALGDTPLWYQTVLISLFLATVGIRWYRRSISDT
jgi:hypothetical protein